MNNIHYIVVRFSDTMFDVGDVVSKHNGVVVEHGQVWFGKIGITIAQKRLDILNDQIEHGIKTYLFLVKGNRKRLTAFKAELFAVTKDFPTEIDLIPSYYKEKNLIQYMKTWMKIGIIESIDLSELNSFRAISSVSSITETLRYSSSSYFFVQESKLIF